MLSGSSSSMTPLPSLTLSLRLPRPLLRLPPPRLPSTSHVSSARLCRRQIVRGTPPSDGVSPVAVLVVVLILPVEQTRVDNATSAERHQHNYELYVRTNAAAATAASMRYQRHGDVQRRRTRTTHSADNSQYTSIYRFSSKSSMPPSVERVAAVTTPFSRFFDIVIIVD